MSFLKTYDKNKKKHLLKEVTGTGAVGGFTGRGGSLIDDLFAGGFHPEFGELEDLLNQQIDGDIMKRMWNDDNTPMADQDFIDLKWDYDYDEIGEIDNSKFKSDSEIEMQLVDLNIKYDKPIDKTEENKKFINDTNDWKSIYDSKKY
tara:strand:+ start:1169 stop:1609 length:441 start_codon:yes stop_codon:yes gene_type:complete